MTAVQRRRGVAGFGIFSLAMLALWQGPVPCQARMGLVLTASCFGSVLSKSRHLLRHCALFMALHVWMQRWSSPIYLR